MELKEIGVGKTAIVYKWDDNKVLKLYNDNTSKLTVFSEYKKSLVVNELSFNKPKAHNIVEFEGKYGIIFDEVNGVTLLDKLMENNDINYCAIELANLHKQVIQKLDSDVDIPFYKEELLRFINSSKISDEEKKVAASKINKLPEEYYLCHGDFHPGNIIVCNKESTLIDFMNVCKGPYLYDIARTVYLILYTPIPEEIDNKEQFMRLKEELAECYLRHMGIEKADLLDYIEVIDIARRGECPDEF